MNVTELRERRANLWNSMKDFLDKRRVNGVLNAEDDAAYNKMEADFNAITNEMHRAERAAEIENELAQPVNAAITSAPAKPAEDKPGRASNAYKDDFGRHLRGRQLVHNVLSEGVPGDGGYLVPTEFERQLITDLAEENVIRRLAKVITTNNERKIPISATHSVATWTAENAAYTESNPTFTQKSLDAYKLTDLARVSVELLQDAAFSVEDYLIAEYARAFGIAEEEAFCVGNGTGKPTGIFTANGGTVGVTSASNSAIAGDDLISLVYALKSPYRRNAAFLMNDATVSMIRKLTDQNKAYLWQPSLQAGQPDRLLGYPLYTSPYVPTFAADALVVAFGDFQTGYWIGDRMNRTVQRLNELYATNGQVGYIATERVDGKVIMAEAIQLLKIHA